LLSTTQKKPRRKTPAFAHHWHITGDSTKGEDQIAGAGAIHRECRAGPRDRNGAGAAAGDLVVLTKA
jgi:hypothetical protein